MLEHLKLGYNLTSPHVYQWPVSLCTTTALDSLLSFSSVIGLVWWWHLLSAHHVTVLHRYSAWQSVSIYQALHMCYSKCSEIVTQCTLVRWTFLKVSHIIMIYQMCITITTESTTDNTDCCTIMTNMPTTTVVTAAPSSKPPGPPYPVSHSLVIALLLLLNW